MPNDDRPFFSVIIPAYNSEEYIGKALASVAAQDFRDFELIVVCDSCHDQTEQVAREHGAITYTVNYGADGLTRDYGLEQAKGKWILFLDDDDWYLHEYCFQQLYDVIKQHPAVDVIAFSYIWKERGYIRQDEETFNDWNRSHVWAKAWRHDVIGNARFGNATYCSDTYFMKAVRPHIKHVLFYDMPMVYYNFMRTGSQTEKVVHGNAYMHPIAKY